MHKFFTLTILTAALASCSGLQNNTDTNQTAKYALTVNLSPDDTPAALEQRYDGHVEVWRADDGFAILGVNQVPINDPAVRGADKNLDATGAPEMPTATQTGPTTEAVTFGGSTAWSGGWTSWGSGSTSWGSGSTSWGSGMGTGTGQSENTVIWKKIGLPAARLKASNLGSGVRIAVIDTGIDLAHPLFTSRLVESADMYDFVGNDAIPQEVGTPGTDAAFGHGTGVAGIIAQVAPNTKIMPLRVLSPNGSGTETAVANAINWAINRNVQIIQLSLGSTTDSTTLGTMVGAAARKGIYIVSSAGNANMSAVTFPGIYGSGSYNLTYNCSCQKYVISVGSVSTSDIKSPFSNYGTGITMTAPGEKVYTPYPQNRLGYWSGTSFAAPMVSGALALAIGQPAGIVPKTQLKSYVTFGDSIDTQNSAYIARLGFGRLNILDFLSWLGL